MNEAAGIELRPTTMSSDGQAVARQPGGRVVFIPGALPGELIQAEIVAERPKSAQARLRTVIEASPDRVAPPCPEVSRGCGACQWQHVAAPAQRSLKEEMVRNALRVAGIDPPPLNPSVALPPWRFRTTVRLAVTDGRAGFRRIRSHDVLAVDACLVAHPLLADLLIGRRYAGAEEVLLRCGERTGERMAAPTPAHMDIDVPAGVRRDHVHEVAAGRTWRISAGSFFQTRADGVDALAALVGEAAGSPRHGDAALDLYSGVGLFAGVLAGAGWSVTAVESAPSALRDARANLKGTTVAVVRADVHAWRPPPARLVVADPSRNGLGRPGVAVVTASGADRLVLVSCDAISLGRDAGLLARAGYGLSSLTLVDLFPHTAHVEVVSVFDRSGRLA